MTKNIVDMNYLVSIVSDCSLSDDEKEQRVHDYYLSLCRKDDKDEA